MRFAITENPRSNPCQNMNRGATSVIIPMGQRYP
jgi:hypothetical protein